jgi:DNA modification methylase
MKIQRVSINSINPAAYNPRLDLKPGDADYEKLKKSIQSFGYVEPLVWNKRTGSLVGGHQRFKILVAEGFKDVDVSVVDLPLDKEKTLNIALNKISGNWDNLKLAKLLEDIKTNTDIDVRLTGFDIPEINKLFDDITQPQEDNFDFDETLNSIKEAITQRGDLIVLGKHRLLCGDASKDKDLAELFQKEKANLVFTDPPYNVDYSAKDRPIAKKTKATLSRKKITNDNQSQAEYESWFKDVFLNLNPYLASGCPAYIWNGHKQFGPMHQILEAMDFHISCVITWAKENFALGYGDYNQQTEFCLYAWKKDNGAHNWYGPTNESTLWRIDRDPTSEYKHPTQKPLALATRAIKNSSKHNDLITDLFLGSGTTLIASEMLNRRCFGMEIDPCYCDAVVKRFVALVGKDNVPASLRKQYKIN